MGTWQVLEGGVQMSPLQHTALVLQLALKPPQVPPSPQLPSIPQGMPASEPPTRVVAHWAMWLWAAMLWKGSQKAGKLVSPVARPSSVKAAIQICGCAQLGWVNCCLPEQAFCGLSGG